MSVKFYLLLMVLYGFMWQSCAKKVNKTGGPLQITESFTSEDINTKVLIGTSFKQEDINKKNLVQFIESSFKPNQNVAAVQLGNSYKDNNKWVYFKIINTSKNVEKLVIETDHLRCDGLTGYEIGNDSLPSLGFIERKTPLIERPYPYRAFALPLTIQPGDTANVLLRSDRYAGFNELKLIVSKEKVFIANTISSNFTQLFLLFFFGALLVLVLMVSVIFSQKNLLYAAFYITVTMLILSNYYGITDTWPIFPIFKLNENNFGQFMPLLSTILFQLLTYQLFKDFIIRKKGYLITITIFSSVVALVLLGILLFPDIQKIAGVAITILLGLSSTWTFIYAVIGLISAKEKLNPMLIFILFLPVIYNFVFSLFTKNLILNSSYFNQILILAVVSVFVISEFKKGLVSKQKAKQKIDDLNQSYEEIRKTEVESIGRYLHDQVGNTLASAIGYLNTKIPNFELTKELIIKSVNEIRFLSHNLVKNDDKALTEKIEELISRFNDFSEIDYKYTDYSNGRINQLNLQVLQNVFMIVQEICTNINKHSFAKEAAVQIFEEEKFFGINIEDDGIGIKNSTAPKGIGMINIEKRAQLSDIKINIESTHEGTVIIIEIPKN